jgi:hypothetical protein
MSQVPNSVSLADSPSALDSETLNQLFPSDSPTSTASVQPLPPAEPVQQVIAPVPAPQEEYLQGENSRYKTREAATQGLNEKDRLIAQLRQQYSLATGVDPITKQPLTQRAPVDENYLSNPDKYLKDLSAAKSAQELTRVQTKLVLDTLQPLQPLITSSAKQQALEQTKSQYQDFGAFYGSPEYTTVLEKTPSLKEAIDMAEGDYRFHNRLPDLYSTAYLVRNGMRLPGVLQEQANRPAPVATPAPRQGVTSTTPPPPQPSASIGLNSPEARKALIAQFEGQQGFDTKTW